MIDCIFGATFLVLFAFPQIVSHYFMRSSQCMQRCEKSILRSRYKTYGNTIRRTYPKGSLENKKNSKSPSLYLSTDKSSFLLLFFPSSCKIGAADSLELSLGP